jgi:hypothetical protein
MKRRTAIRNVVLMSAGVAFLYSCKEDADLLSELTEFIIPGIKDLKSPEFVTLMADDCMPPEDHKKFTDGKNAFGKAKFVRMSPGERKDFVSKLDGDAKFFFEMVKQGTIYNFTTSQEYLANVKNITTLVPPKFEACVTVNA